MPYTLLVVDDEESILFAMGEYFRLRGCEVDCAREAEEAEALLAHRHYSAVVADLRLTGSYGTEGLQLVSDVCRRSRGTRVVLLTAHGSREIEAEALRRGADALLHKPQPLAEVARVVFSLLEKKRKNEQPMPA